MWGALLVHQHASTCGGIPPDLDCTDGGVDRSPVRNAKPTSLVPQACRECWHRQVDEIHSVHLSRNEEPQPFYLICEKDTLVVVFPGTGRIEREFTSVRSFSLKAGDRVRCARRNADPPVR
jgi:hypothetical protein